MAAHIVKCLYCKQSFDAQPKDENVVWFKPRSNRYAHVSCRKAQDANLSKEEKEFDELYKYVSANQGKNFNFVQFQKIVEAWRRDYKYTYSGILKSLLYFYEVKGNSKEKFKEGSIGIVPFCYTQAYNYYYEIYMANQRAGTGTYNKTSFKKIDIEPPVAKRLPPKLFDSDDMEDEDEE